MKLPTLEQIYTNYIHGYRVYCLSKSDNAKFKEVYPSLTNIDLEDALAKQFKTMFTQCNQLNEASIRSQISHLFDADAGKPDDDIRKAVRVLHAGCEKLKVAVGCSESIEKASESIRW